MAAVKIRGGCKHYGMANNSALVLNNLNMTVLKGSIYGLLGASGCGKTTILSCIVGRLKLNSGEVLVLGSTPGSKGSGVPGCRVGYMPQELGLVGEFTVKGAISYFGRIAGMKSRDIEERFYFLSKLLELPPEDRFVKNLSGGQQRRLSFAAALVHNPELLILDEPTVGLDPVIRASIWEYFVNATVNHTVTIVITTHYIEEAAQAHRVGLMRNGKLLAERAPLPLIQSLNCSSLEEVFLMLSRKQENTQLQTLSAIANSAHVSSLDQDIIELSDICNSDDEDSVLALGQDEESYELSHISNIGNRDNTKKRKSRWSGRMRALLNKNVAQLCRDYGGLLLIVLFPTLQFIQFFWAIGGEPWGFKLAIVNEELGNMTNCEEYSHYNPIIPTLKENGRCEFAGLSCNYLKHIKQQEKIYYKEYETALHDVKKGHVTAMLHFASNFTRQLQQRYDRGSSISTAAIEESKIHVFLDMSNVVIKLTVEKQLLEAFMGVGKDVTRLCNISEKVFSPAQINDPIYGTFNENFQTFVAPAFLLSMVFFLAMLITVTVIITERLEGVWDRSLVQGVSTSEILFAHLISLTPCMVAQVAVVLVISFDIFGLRCMGNRADVVFLILLQGFSGLCFGFLISTAFDTYITAGFFAAGSFLPNVVLSGMVWPLEGMPIFLQKISIIFPSTIPVMGLRDIMQRGKGITQPTVYGGFLISALWIVIPISACIIILKVKNR